MGSEPIYRRVLLKLSGEALMGDREFGLDPDIIARIGQEIRSVSENGVQVCLVIGGGNIFRGVSGAGHAVGTGKPGHPDPRAFGHQHAIGLRTLYPPPGGAPYGEGPGGDLRRRHR